MRSFYPLPGSTDRGAAFLLLNPFSVLRTVARSAGRCNFSFPRASLQSLAQLAVYSSARRLLPGLLLYLAVRPLLAVLHELMVLVAADGLALLGSSGAVLASTGWLPVDPVYTSTLFFILADVDVLGVAVASPVGDLLRALWPGLFTTPDLLASGAWASAVIGPGASVLGRAAAVLSGDVTLLALGLLLVRLGGRARDRRRAAAPPPDPTNEATPDRPGLAAGWLVVVGALVQAHVLVNHLADRPASLADLDAAGLTYGFSVLFSGAAVERPRLGALLKALPEPLRDGLLVLAAVVLAYLLAAVLVQVGLLTWRLLRRAGAGPLQRPVRGPESNPARPTAGRLARSALPAFALLVATSPLGSLADANSRLLDYEPAPAEAALAALPEPSTAGPALAVEAPPDAASGPVESNQTQAPSAPVAPAAQPSPTPATVGLPAHLAARLAPLPSVAVEGGDYHYTYLVDGQPTVIRGMGYNPVYRGLPDADRQARLDRDFLEMSQAGVDTVLGWVTDEFDELLLDQAEENGLGVILPFDLAPGLDYSNPDVRASLRRDVLAWIGRYRDHPAVRMWGIGNEVLHKLVYPSWMRRAGDPILEARADAFTRWYVDLIDEIHRLDPDHPIVYRDAEDAYLPRLRTALNANGIHRPWFVYGINIYTPRLSDLLKAWPGQGLDTPLLISEFAPGGAGPADRPRGYREMWSMIRRNPEPVLGGAPYVWTTDGPEEVDRVFGLVDGSGQAVDGSLAAIAQMYHGEAAAVGEQATAALQPCSPAVSELLIRTVHDLQQLGGRTAFQAALPPSIMGPLDNLPADPIEAAQLHFERANEPARLSWQRAAGYEAEWWASWTPPSRTGDQLALLVRQRGGRLEIAYVYHGPGLPSPLAVNCPS